MLDSCIIPPNGSSFSAPIVMVRKKDNYWRMCPNYKDLNKITIEDKFPIPNINELLYELHGVAYFTKLDLKSRYHQIKLRKEDVQKQLLEHMKDTMRSSFITRIFLVLVECNPS
jgi:hypothetical protein